MLAELRSEQRAQVRAILSNGGYLQTEEGISARRDEIERLNAHFDSVIEHIQDPGKAEREQRELEENPLFAAGMRGLDRLKWEFYGAQQTAEQLRQQGIVA